MPDDGVLPGYLKGERLSALKLTDLAGAVNKLKRSVEVLRADFTAQLKLGNNFSPPIARARFVGVIRDSGPNDEDDYEDDPRYWVERLASYPTEDSTALFNAAVDTGSDAKQYVTATNLAEITFNDDGDVTGNAHTQKPGDVVEVLLMYLDSDPETYFWCFNKARKEGIFVADLTQNGGTLGDNTTAPDATYDATDEGTGDSLGTALARERPSPVGKVTAATKGYVRYDSDGNFVLVEPWEVEDTTADCDDA